MKAYDIRSDRRAEQPTAVMKATLRVSEIGPWLGRVYGSVAGRIAARDSAPAGPPFARYHRLGQDDRFAVEAGFPVARPVEEGAGVLSSSLPGGPVATTTHIGPYGEMEPAYQALTAWIREHGGEPVGDPWEIYLTEPGDHPDPATWRTDVVQPYRRP